MADFGLLTTGFRVKTEADIRASMVAALRAKWGASYDLSEGSPDGQLVSIEAAEIAEAWAALLALYGQLSRDTATGVGLDAQLILTGTLRAEAAPSSVTLLLVGASGTAVATGSRVLALSTSSAWRTIADVTIAAADAWAALTAYVAGDLVTTGGNVYRCLSSGVDLSSVAPTGTDADIADGDLHWEYLAAGDGTITVTAVSVDTGPVVGGPRDLTVIDTPIGGWNLAINLADATLGTEDATDAEARIAGEEDLYRAAATTKDAIRQTLLRIADVTSVHVFQNTTDAVDADGVPAHAIECLVDGGDEQTILDTIWAECAAAGIATHGTTTGTIIDSEGVAQTVEFSRPTTKRIHVKVTLVKVAHDDADPDSYPTDGDAQIKAEIVAWGQARQSGYNVVASKIAAIANSIAGVLDVAEVLISVHPTDPPVASTTLAISTRERATYARADIVVVTSDGVP